MMDRMTCDFLKCHSERSEQSLPLSIRKGIPRSENATRDGRLLTVCLHIGLLALLLIAVACDGSRVATWRRIQEEGVLRIGVDPTYPPFATLEGEELVGIDAELGRALAADLGLAAEFRYFGYDGLYDALATEQVDLLISALVVRPEMTRDFAYSAPYFDAGQVLVIPEGSEIEGLAELGGRALAVELGAEGHVIATEWQRRLAGLEVAPQNTADEALGAALNGEADAALVDAISARLYLASNAGLALAGEPVAPEPYAIVFRIEDEALQEAVEASLERLRSRGELDEILARWMD
jgi:polar amino acid transport system substrate-binding protein